MAEDLGELGRQILADLLRSSLTGALPAESALAKPNRLPRMALAPSGEDFEKRLRGIRRLITVKEYAGLEHSHTETVYRRIKSGMPVHRDGRNVKIYPPQIADWLLEIRETRKRRMSMPAAFGPKPDDTGYARTKEREKAK